MLADHHFKWMIHRTHWLSDPYMPYTYLSYLYIEAISDLVLFPIFRVVLFLPPIFLSTYQFSSARHSWCQQAKSLIHMASMAKIQNHILHIRELCRAAADSGNGSSLIFPLPQTLDRIPSLWFDTGFTTNKPKGYDIPKLFQSNISIKLESEGGLLAAEIRICHATNKTFQLVLVIFHYHLPFHISYYAAVQSSLKDPQPWPFYLCQSKNAHFIFRLEISLYSLLSFSTSLLHEEIWMQMAGSVQELGAIGSGCYYLIM